MKLAALTTLALAGFAANSLLCRAALREGAIDAASFTAVRLACGALVLALMVAARDRGGTALLRAGTWRGAAALLTYALAFAFAYRGLTAGTGALLLFGAVQAALFGAALLAGSRPRFLEWLGLAMALAGLAGLVAPGWEAPPPGAAALMVLAGLAWGAYTWLGARSRRPLADTAGSFLRCAPAALLLLPAVGDQLHVSPSGFLLAALSGGLASGLAYALWYAVVPGLGPTRAAVVQLLVPVLAAVAGVLLLGEPASLRLAASGAAVLGGVGLALAVRRSAS